MSRGHRQVKKDRNHQEVCDGLRAADMSVVDLSVVGKGCPDICVGWRGVNVLLEIKDPAKPPSKRALTEDEAEFQLHWRGHMFVVHSAAEAIAYVEGEVKQRRT